MRYKCTQKGIPKDVKAEIQTLCAGYYRRKRIEKMRREFLSGEPSEEFKAFMQYNENIDKALSFLEEGLKPYILYDIANGVGYWSSMASPFLTCNAYYARKNQAMENLAKELSLMI